MRDRRGYEVIDSRQMDHLRVFHDVARAVTAHLELEEILRAIMEKMAGFFGPERWSLLLVDEARESLYYAIAVGENQQTLEGLRVPMGEGVAGWVAKTGNPLIVPDVRLDPKWSVFVRAHPELNIQSIACVPIGAAGQSLGVIQLLNSKLDLLSEYSISFLRILCDYAAIAISNHRSMKLIHELTIRDDCTGLYNARHLYAQLEEQTAGSMQFSLLFLDLDRFKSVNDTHGHLIGSGLLAEVGTLLKRAMEPGGSCFRYGGDEFVVLLPEFGKKLATRKTVELHHALRAEHFMASAGLDLQLSGSFGLASYPEDGATVEAMLKSADAMMYAAKAHRDAVVIAGQGLVASKGVELDEGSQLGTGGAAA